MTENKILGGIRSYQAGAAKANYLSSKSDLQRAEASVEPAKFELDSSRLDLGSAVIRSPIDGILISRNMEAGQTVQANFQAVKMFEISTDLSKMRLECDVDEADIGMVIEGQRARFTVDAFPESEFEGRGQQRHPRRGPGERPPGRQKGDHRL